MDLLQRLVGCDSNSNSSNSNTTSGTEPPLEVLTVDRYQGRDKQCIILSFVRSNEKREAGRLLSDWQRINVAVTRAKTKLLMVGSAATLSQVPVLAAMLQLLRERGWVVALRDVPGGVQVPGAGAGGEQVKRA